jgi:hypothetical protein
MAKIKLGNERMNSPTRVHFRPLLVAGFESLSFSLGELDHKDIPSRWQMYSISGPSCYLSAQRMR